MYLKFILFINGLLLSCLAAPCSFSSKEMWGKGNIVTPQWSENKQCVYDIQTYIYHDASTSQIHFDIIIVKTWQTWNKSLTKCLDLTTTNYRLVGTCVNNQFQGMKDNQGNDCVGGLIDKEMNLQINCGKLSIRCWGK